MAGKANPATGTLSARQSKSRYQDRRCHPTRGSSDDIQKGNCLWHSDSSFKAAPSLCSLLSARIVPPDCGNTEFASMRAAYDALPDDIKQRLELVAEHSLVCSRGTVSSEMLTPKMKAELPRHQHKCKLVQVRYEIMPLQAGSAPAERAGRWPPGLAS